MDQSNSTLDQILKADENKNTKITIMTGMKHLLYEKRRIFPVS